MESHSVLLSVLRLEQKSVVSSELSWDYMLV
jgi:hypothetical protein